MTRQGSRGRTFISVYYWLSTPFPSWSFRRRLQLWRDTAGLPGKTRKISIKFHVNRVPMNIKKIVSGGQTGADRGGLDAAIEMGVPHGGWCPMGRLAEDGKIPEKYSQKELYSRKYSHRTEQNVIDSDVTLIFTYGLPEGGSKRTAEFAEMHSKPYLWVDMDHNNQKIIDKISSWLMEINADEIVLNVAGSRGSSEPDLQERVCEIIKKVIN